MTLDLGHNYENEIRTSDHIDQIFNSPQHDSQKDHNLRVIIERREIEKQKAKSNLNKNHINDIAALVINAQLLVRHEEYSLATHLLRQALYLNSFHKESLKLLFKCFQNLGQLHQAMRVLFLIDRIEETFESAATLGNFQYDHDQYAEAKESFYRALNKVNDNHELLFEVYKNLGNIFFKEGDVEGTEEFYHKAYSMNPDSSPMLVNLGTLAFQKDEMDVALTRFRRALEINPKNDKAWVGLSIVHAKMSDQVLAQANLDAALDVNPMNRTAVQLAANWGLNQKRYEHVIEVLCRYLSGINYDEEMSLLLTHTFCLNGQLNYAKIELERMLLWNPKNPQLHQIEKELKGNP